MKEKVLVKLIHRTFRLTMESLSIPHILWIFVEMATEKVWKLTVINIKIAFIFVSSLCLKTLTDPLPTLLHTNPDILLNILYTYMYMYVYVYVCMCAQCYVW